HPHERLCDCPLIRHHSFTPSPKCSHKPSHDTLSTPSGSWATETHTSSMRSAPRESPSPLCVTKRQPSQPLTPTLAPQGTWQSPPPPTVQASPTPLQRSPKPRRPAPPCSLWWGHNQRVENAPGTSSKTCSRPP